jgi:riboflavin biosynthesis pyrimidine reductase
MAGLSVYPSLEFPAPPAGRPYVFINMVATIDGKILSGERDENVMDLGSPCDHATMRFIESQAHAVMIGAGSLRSTVGLHYQAGTTRLVVSSSGRLDFSSRFFQGDRDKAWVVTGSRGVGEVAGRAQTFDAGDPVDWFKVMAWLRSAGVERLLVEGGSELNASLLAMDLVDELFLTVAPKVKLGRDVPTYADGEPLPRERLLRYGLVSCLVHGDEVFLRYRRAGRF